MALDISTLEQTISRLEEGLVRYRRDITDLQIRDGLIQRFELAYELSHKILKRYLASVSASPAEYDQFPFQDLIRKGNELGLLRSPWPRWRTFRELRSKTSHTYNEEVAIDVTQAIPDFLEEAIFLRDRLRELLG
jgi:nucleotidyltransferase substrate binding protein (TIGR01987 family)